MAQKMTEEQKGELQIYFGNSKIGIIYFLQYIFALLALIGFFCPLFSYNLTKIDALKETVGIADVPIAIGGMAFLAIAVILAIVTMTLFQKAVLNETQAALGKKLIGITVGVGATILISVILGCMAYVLYDVPSSGYDYIELDFEAGFYLFIIGSLIFFACNLLFTVVARNVLNGKINREQLLFHKKSAGKEDNPNIAIDRTLEEKLTELKRLRDAGILSEEEFDTKKKEFMNNLK